MKGDMQDLSKYLIDLSKYRNFTEETESQMNEQKTLASEAIEHLLGARLCLKHCVCLLVSS